MNSRLPDLTEKEIRRLCSEYPKNKELIDDALEESLDAGVRKPMLQDLALGRGYAKSSIHFMSEVSYKREKQRAKICIAQRFGLPTSRAERRARCEAEESEDTNELHQERTVA